MTIYNVIQLMLLLLLHIRTYMNIFIYIYIRMYGRECTHALVSYARMHAESRAQWLLYDRSR